LAIFDDSSLKHGNNIEDGKSNGNSLKTRKPEL